LNGILLKAKRIDLIEPERGKYIRIVAGIVANGVDISGLMLEKGYARQYEGGKRLGWCK